MSGLSVILRMSTHKGHTQCLCHVVTVCIQCVAAAGSSAEGFDVEETEKGQCPENTWINKYTHWYEDEEDEEEELLNETELDHFLTRW